MAIAQKKEVLILRGVGEDLELCGKFIEVVREFLVKVVGKRSPQSN